MKPNQYSTISLIRIFRFSTEDFINFFEKLGKITQRKYKFHQLTVISKWHRLNLFEEYYIIGIRIIKYIIRIRIIKYIIRRNKNN